MLVDRQYRLHGPAWKQELLVGKRTRQRFCKSRSTPLDELHLRPQISMRCAHIIRCDDGTIGRRQLLGAPCI